MNEKVFKILGIAACLLGLWLGMIIGEYFVYGYEYTPEEMVMIGKIVQHEAPHESELGQRLVIDTIMNRVESDQFPNTVKEVLEQPGQYCSPKKLPPDDIYKIIDKRCTNELTQMCYITEPNIITVMAAPSCRRAVIIFPGGKSNEHEKWKKNRRVSYTTATSMSHDTW